uniref:Putative secreted protein n=1 Tax=Amblyomma cajennense TaxID=34607 RepID=A0A023FDB9_AMBCJ
MQSVAPWLCDMPSSAAYGSGLTSRLLWCFCLVFVSISHSFLRSTQYWQRYVVLAEVRTTGIPTVSSDHHNTSLDKLYNRGTCPQLQTFGHCLCVNA